MTPSSLLGGTVRASLARWTRLPKKEAQVIHRTLEVVRSLTEKTKEERNHEAATR